MKFKDLMTGNTLETDNEEVIEQYRHYPERYEEVSKVGRPRKDEI